MSLRYSHEELFRSLQALEEATFPKVFRNCVCGSTLLEVFYDRRDQTANGLKRRQRFGELLDKLIADGVDPQVARTELLKVVRGQPHNLIGLIRATKDGAGD